MTSDDTQVRNMERACEIARRGEGLVEPNPMVGCVIAIDDRIVAEGWHRKCGGPHAEVEALQKLQLSPSQLRQASLFVTLEPCCHIGKTPPCTEAIIQSGIKKVVVAVEDPFPKVSGRGVRRLRAAGLDVEVGVGRRQATHLLSPYLKLQTQRRPWVIAKWAMTLDGKIATRERDSQWISSAASREVAHRIRARVDGILVGIGTVQADDPLLTPRPPGPRVPVRIVLDSRASLSRNSQLVRTASEHPVLLCSGPDADEGAVELLESLGVEVLRLQAATYDARLAELLDELGARRLTNVLVEGGGKVLGSLFDMREIDEVHAFIAPKVVGGDSALTPIGGVGIGAMQASLAFGDCKWQQIENDFYFQGRVAK